MIHSNNTSSSNNLEQGQFLDKLSLSSQDYVSMLDACVDAVIIINQEGVVHYFNASSESMFGYDRKETLGQNVKLLMNYTDAKNHDTYIDSYISTKQAKVIGKGREVIAKHKSGKEFPVLLTLSAVKVESQYLFTAFIKDISERKRLESEVKQQLEEVQASEEELRQNMEELQATQDKQEQLAKALKQSEAEIKGKMTAINTSYALIEFSPEGYVLDANPIFLEKMSYSLEEIKGKHHSIFVENTYARSEDYRKFWANLSTGLTKSGTYQRFDKQGQEVWLEAAYAPVFEDNKVSKIIKIARDVTDFTVALKATQNFLGELRKGNFDAKIHLQEKQIEGDLADMIEDNLKLRDTLKAILEEVNRVVSLAGKEGILSERLKITESKGAWKDLTESLNALLQSIAEPILELNRIITNLSMGNIAQSFEKEAKGDILDMALALNIALRNLNELLAKIEETSLVIATASEQMQSKSTGLQNSTQEASVAIQDMADGAQEQANRTDESSRLVEETLKAALEVSNKAEIINNTAEKGQQNCQSGLGIMQSLVENMDDIANSADTTTEAIAVLSNRSEEISRILNVITDIAFQTKLLSVNAKIEANRAGEYGRGFQVVADEIGKLAEESKQSTVEIDKVIKDVQKDVQSTSHAIENMKDSVKNGHEATQKVSTVFNQISDSSVQTLELSKEIREASQDQKDAIDAVVHNIEKIVIVSEETASGTQEVANSARETDKAMQEITQTSQKLSEVATLLKESVNKFKLKR